MRNKMLLALFSVLVILAVAVFPVGAVTDGQPDGEGHPFVGLMIAYDENGDALWRCSGTLLSSTVFLTAGHCTESPAVSATVWFDADVQALPTCFEGTIGDACYPYGGGDSYYASTIATHPDFYTAPFFVHDVGVVVLDTPAVKSKYGVLPAENQLDELKTKRGQQGVTFTAVGYGLQQSFPDASYWKTHNVKVRMVAYPKLNQINVPGFTGDYSMLLSNNANTGGTCFGDSGGPNFLGDTNIVAGVTSFGINGNCAGTGGVFRMDRENVLDFVNSFLD
jgi:secreted trypsin-like serine protease